jgi:hypothetical protein
VPAMKPLVSERSERARTVAAQRHARSRVAGQAPTTESAFQARGGYGPGTRRVHIGAATGGHGRAQAGSHGRSPRRSAPDRSSGFGPATPKHGVRVSRPTPAVGAAP